jgi:glycosyltransferase involved in cell wall biosynthesis
MNIYAHTLVKNEENYIWFSVMSVIDYVDKIMIWDTGSTDNTLKIAKYIKRKFKGHVELVQLGDVDIHEFADVRQEMLNKTESDWFIVVDGDEIWWDNSIKKVVDKIKMDGDNLESIVVPTYNLVGDIFHYQESKAGRYRLAGKEGHLNLRGVNRKIPGLSSANPHGTWGWVDDNGKMIQDRDNKRIVYVDAHYLHASFLERAGDRAEDLNVPKRKKKLKHEIGISFPKDFYYPEVLFQPHPEFVSSPWRTMTEGFYARALIETPLRKINRRLFRGKIGY